MKFLIHPAVEASRLQALRGVIPPGLEVVLANVIDEEEALGEIAEADVVLGKLTPAMLQRAQHLQWVQAFTASLEHYIFPELVEHPCVLTNMRGLFDDVIADQVMGYVLCFARNLHVYLRQQIEHRYEPRGSERERVDFASGPGRVNAIDRATIDLRRSRMGIFGFGRAGQEIARRAVSFGMTVIGVDRRPERKTVPEGVDAVWGLELLPQLIRNSEFLVISAPHTPETEGLFDSEMIGRMKPGSYLINIGRGAIVKLDAVVDALRSGHLAGAALDVYEIEPLPTEHPLWDEPNAILTPHTAGYSTRIAERHLSTLLENVSNFCHGRPLMNVVNKHLWF